MNRNIGITFAATGLGFLIAGLFLGCIAAFQFLYPTFFTKYLLFHQTRPMHVFLAISWIFLGAIGGVYYYLPKISKRPLAHPMLPWIHYLLFLLGTALVVHSFANDVFGGREYFNFPPALALAFVGGWLLFAANFFRTIPKPFRDLPVYLWMWATGVFTFLYCVAENHFWLFPHFSSNIGRDLTVQWKSLGSLVGSWNMLIYGTAIYLMCRISKSEDYSFCKKAFFLYFVGLTNMMFNWGHHTYIVPAAPWLRHVAYFVSMTELIILGVIIWEWKSTLSTAKKNFHILPYRFLLASEIWVFLNLALALAISVPAINIYTHGTHVTVAHAMGATIGINTMILLASISFMFSERNLAAVGARKKVIIWGNTITNLSLFVFLVCLISAGIIRGQMNFGEPVAFQTVLAAMNPYMFVFAISGVGILIGLLMISIPLLLTLGSKSLYEYQGQDVEMPSSPQTEGNSSTLQNRMYG